MKMACVLQREAKRYLLSSSASCTRFPVRRPCHFRYCSKKSCRQKLSKCNALFTTQTHLSFATLVLAYTPLLRVLLQSVAFQRTGMLAVGQKISLANSFGIYVCSSVSQSLYAFLYVVFTLQTRGVTFAYCVVRVNSVICKLIVNFLFHYAETKSLPHPMMLHAKTIALR